MLLKRNDQRTHGIFFAVWPRRTPDGWVAFEWLHWELIESWGWGSSCEYRYARFVSNELYDKGVRRKFWGGKAWEDIVDDPPMSGIPKRTLDEIKPYSDHSDPLRWPDPAPGG